MADAPLIVLDTETTGLNAQHDRIIEIAAMVVDSDGLTTDTYHQYINPERSISEAASRVHNITIDQVKDEPVFAEIAEDFIQFVKSSTLVIHNAPFDVRFLNAELLRAGLGTRIESVVTDVIDTLPLARRMFPGMPNSLDALCQRYGIDKSSRTYHGALIDTALLAKVYQAMRNSQMKISYQDKDSQSDQELSSDEWQLLSSHMVAFAVNED